MKHWVRDRIKGVAHRVGVDIVRLNTEPHIPVDFSDEDVRIIRKTRGYTAASVERTHALLDAVRYVVDHNVPGAICECGVWRGGSMMAVAMQLINRGCTDRDLYLFDTFEGMPRPTDHDVDIKGSVATEKFERVKTSDAGSEWVNAPLDQVRDAMASTGYPQERIHFVKGMVEQTIPSRAPAQLALLRLDTDWYESTRHELEHLYPRLTAGGVLLIDDYGHWQGARKATDEYMREHNVHLLLHRVDYTARLAVKGLPAAA